MKLPKSFRPAKDLDEKVKELSQEVYKIYQLTKRRIEYYDLKRRKDFEPEEGYGYLDTFIFLKTSFSKGLI